MSIFSTNSVSGVVCAFLMYRLVGNFEKADTLNLIGWAIISRHKAAHFMLSLAVAEDLHDNAIVMLEALYPKHMQIFSAVLCNTPSNIAENLIEIQY